MNTLIELFTTRIWFPWLLGAILLVGLLFSFQSGFFPLFRFPLWWHCTMGSLFTHTQGNHGTLSSIQALSTALASTIGTGSIVGVTTALTLGGPGAVFWMWVCALCGMMTSCIEKLLAVRYQCTAPDGQLQGGPMFYLRAGLHAPTLAMLFCIICLPATLTGGNLIQSSAISDTLEQSLGIPRLLCGIGTALLVALCISGGIHRIARISTILVPVMAILYLGSSLFILITHAYKLPYIFHDIFQSALTPSSAWSGAGGWSVASAIRYGVARGVFTNEAGLGTSAIAHGAAHTDHPARQGMWGIFEVFCSSFLVCTTTALVILVTEVPITSPLSGVQLTCRAFEETFPLYGTSIVSLTLLLFAFSSLLGWSYYGQQALQFLCGNRPFLVPYRILFLLCVVAGSVWDSQLLWTLVDLFNALLAIPNLIALLLLSPQAFNLLFLWEQNQKKRGITT